MVVHALSLATPIESTIQQHAFPESPLGPSHDDHSWSHDGACSNWWHGASSSASKSIKADKRLDVASSIVKHEANPAIYSNAKREDADPDAIYTYHFKDDAAKREANPAVNAKREDADPDAIYTYHFKDDDTV